MAEAALLELCDAFTQANQVTPPLLRLPAELRNKIYAYVCGSTATITFYRDGKDWCSKRWYFRRDRPGLRSTCRQLHKEVTAVLRVYDTIVLDGRVPAQDLVNLIGEEQCIRLRVIRMHECILSTIRYGYIRDHDLLAWVDKPRIAQLFQSLQCVEMTRYNLNAVVVYEMWEGERESDAEIQVFLRAYFEKPELEVVFR